MRNAVTDATHSAPASAGSALELRDVSVSLPSAYGPLEVLHSISLTAASGRILALAGESGSGKSTAMFAALRLLPAGAKLTGTIHVNGADVTAMARRELRELRARHARVVFQDPWSALHPMRTIGAQLIRSARLADPALSRSAAAEAAVDAMTRVGIPDAGPRMKSYPHQLSGGQLQRVVIAAALVAKPRLLLCDEPTTALDVTTQAQVIELLKELNESTGLTIVIATHDLSVVAGFADDLVVMYAGQVVERGPAQAVLTEPQHPYSWSLLEAAPQRGRGERLRPIPGRPPLPGAVPPGCAFADRCAFVSAECRTGQMSLTPLSRERSTACVRVQETAATRVTMAREDV